MSLALEKATSDAGIAYAQVKPTLIGKLSEEQGKTIIEKFTTPMRDVAASAFSG